VKHKWLYIVGGVFLLLLIVLLVLPFVVDVNQFRPKIESAASAALNRKVEVGNIRLSILSAGVTVDNVSISDDPAFNSGLFARTKSIAVGVKLMPLIFSRHLEISGITVNEPEATLLRTPSGKWNFSSMGSGSTPKGGSSEPGSATNVSVSRLTIKGGKLSMGEVGRGATLLTYQKIDLEVTDFSFDSQFAFKLSAVTPANGSLNLAGKAGPINQASMEKTPLDVSLAAKHLDLTSLGIVDAASGIAGLLDINAVAHSDGQRATSQFQVNASQFKLVQGASPAGEPVQLDYDVDYDLKSLNGMVKRGDVRIGKALAHLTGSFANSRTTPTVQMKFVGQNMPAADLVSFLPAVGAALPAGTSVEEGTLDVNLSITGPVDRLVTSGPVSLNNTKLAGFNLGSKLGALSSVVGVPKGSDTTIQSFSTVAHVAPEGMRADSIDLVLPGIGTITGDGTISPQHALDFKMLANVSGSGGALKAVSAVGTVTGQKGGAGIPFHIEGTTSNPSFVPDVGGAVAGVGKGAISGVGTVASTQGVGGSMGGLLGKNKKP